MTAVEPLDVVAGKIKQALKKSDNYVLTAGKLLLEAKERVQSGEAGKITWKSWIDKNLGCSYRHSNRLIGYAKDPQKIEAHREHTRRDIAKRREKERESGTNVCPTSEETTAEIQAVREIHAARDASSRADPAGHVVSAASKAEKLAMAQEILLALPNEDRDKLRVLAEIWSALNKTARASILHMAENLAKAA